MDGQTLSNGHENRNKGTVHKHVRSVQINISEIDTGPQKRI